MPDYGEMKEKTKLARREIRFLKIPKTMKPRRPEKSEMLVIANRNHMLKHMVRLCVDGWWRLPETIGKELAKGNVDATPFHDPLKDGRNVNDFDEWRRKGGYERFLRTGIVEMPISDTNASKDDMFPSPKA